MVRGVWGQRNGQRRFGGSVLWGIGLVPLLAGSSLAADSQVTAPITVGTADSDNAVPVQAVPAIGVSGPVAPVQPNVVPEVPTKTATPITGRLWSFTPTVEVGETYNDNVNLTPKGQAQADFISTVSPGFNFLVNGTRVNLNLTYNPELAYYARGTVTSPQLLQRLLGVGKAELYPEAVFLNANASINQQFVNSTGAIGNSNLTGNSNSQTVQTYDVSPELRHHFGDYADTDSQYHFGSTTVGGNQVAPSNTNSFLQTVKGGVYFNNLSWTLTANSTRTTTESGGGTTDPLAGTTSKDDVARADLGYSLSFLNLPSWSVLGGFGYERLSDQTLFQQLNGPLWDAGFKFQPNTYFQAQATYGRRFEKPNYAFSSTYNPGPQTAISVQYSETVQTQSALQQTGLENASLSSTGQIQFTQVGQPIPIGNTALGTIGLFGLSNATFLDKSFSVNIRETRGRDTYVVTAFDTTETINFPAINQREIGASVAWNRQLWPDLSSNLSAGYNNTNFGDGSGRVDDLYTFSAGLSYTLSETATATLSLSRFERLSNAAGGSLNDDIIALLVHKSF